MTADMKSDEKPIANPWVLLREEFDDWAVLYDPDTGHGFGLSPTGVYLWKLLDGERSIDDMVTALRRDATDLPEETGEQILAFVEELAQHGLVTHNAEQVHDSRERVLPSATGIAENLPDGGHEAGQVGSGMLRYERPRLEPLNLERPAHGMCFGGSGDNSFCQTGNSAKGSGQTYSCHDGSSATGAVDACHDGGTASGGSSVACYSTGTSAFGSPTKCWSTGSGA
jgi:SynChlorMet cassette protein ScmD